MFSHFFTLLGLLAFTSAGLLGITPNTPSKLYLPAPSTQQQTNTLTRTSQSIHFPAVVTSSQQLPVVPVPASRNTVQKSAHIYSGGVPSVSSSLFYPNTAHQLTLNSVKSSQPAQIQQVHYQQIPTTVFQQVPLTRQTNSGVQHVTSTVNTNTLVRNLQPVHTHATAIPSLDSTAFHQIPVKQVAIVRLANENVGDGTYSYNYETENGITAEEHGQPNVIGAETVERVQGSYSYTGPDNVRYTINYVADENGYRAEGAHLPVPPTPIAQVSQVTSRTSQINSNVVGARSSGVHVIPTTVISQPIHIVPTPGSQGQRQATTVQTSFRHQIPVIQSVPNVFRQATVEPSSTLTVHQGSTGFTNQQTITDSVETQGNPVPSFVTVQQGSIGHSTQQNDAVQTQVHHHQSTVVPSTVTVQTGAVGYTGASEAVQRAALHQNTVVPASTVSVQQHGTTSYSTQHTGVGSFNAQLSGLQRQASTVPLVQQGVHYNSQQFGQQTETQQGVVQNEHTFAAGSFSALQDNTQQPQKEVVQNAVVPSNTVSVQQSTATEQSGIVGVAQSTVPSNTASIQSGITTDNVYGTAQRQAAAVSSGVVPIHLGRTGIINQRNSIQASEGTQLQTSGVSTSHVTVQLGTAGYATEQVGDVSSVQIYGSSSLQNAFPANTNAQQVSQQTSVQSQNVSTTVSENQTTNSNQAATVSQSVVLPDGSVHNGY